MKKIRNKLFTKNEFFIACCAKASVDPTMRQASKFQNEKGSAYKVRKSVSLNTDE